LCCSKIARYRSNRSSPTTRPLNVSGTSQPCTNPKSTSGGVSHRASQRFVLGDGSHGDVQALSAIAYDTTPSCPSSFHTGEQPQRRSQSCGCHWQHSYSDHDTQKCGAAGTDRNGSDDGFFGVEFRLQLAQSAACDAESLPV
jgi:hypothetical protein